MNKSSLNLFFLYIHQLMNKSHQIHTFMNIKDSKSERYIVIIVVNQKLVLEHLFTSQDFIHS